jgi:chemotaxis protein MotD
MTAAVGNASPGGSEPLMQAVTVKGSQGVRGRMRNTQDKARTTDGNVDQKVSNSKADTADVRVDRLEKRSKQDKSDGSSEDDSAFANMFDSIGLTQMQDSSPTPAQPLSSPNGADVAQLVASQTILQQTPIASSQPTSQQSAARSTLFLPQKSILALMDAREKQQTKATDTDATDGTSAKTEVSNSETPASETDFVPMTVEGSETHWNFVPHATSDVGAKISALQASDQSKEPAVLIQSAATAKNAKAPQVDSNASQGTEQRTVQPVLAFNSEQAPDSSTSNQGNNNQGGAKPDIQPQPSSATQKTTNDDPIAALDRVVSAKDDPQPSPSAVTTQVRTGVLQALATDHTTTDASASTAPPDLPSRPNYAPIVRTLDLTLSPPDLGSVKLRLSLKSNSLEIEAEASKASTAKLLVDDRPNLEKGLKDAGYDVSSLKIADASASSSSTGNGWLSGGSQSRDGEQSRSNFAGRQDGEMQRGDGSSSDQAQRRPKQNNPQTATAEGAVRSGNAVYI